MVNLVGLVKVRTCVEFMYCDWHYGLIWELCVCALVKLGLEG